MDKIYKENHLCGFIIKVDMKILQNLEIGKSFFRDKCYITNGKRTIYFNEIILPDQFKKIYSQEKIIMKLEKEINTAASRPFFNIPASICRKNGISKGKILILRINNFNRTYQIITKVNIWGKISVPKEVINTLGISHKQKVSIEIIKESETSATEEVNLSSLLQKKEKLKILKRENNFVTIYSSGKFPITLPNNISLDPELIEIFFLIHGDGHYKDKLFFSNKEPELHQSVMRIFQKHLSIPMFIWRARVNLNDSYKEEVAKSCWLNALNLDVRQFYPSVSRTKFNTSAQGDLRIVIDYPIVSEIFRGIFTYIQQNLNETLSFHALNGLLAAEGGAQISKVGLHRITLSYNVKEKELFRKVLEKCGVLHLFKDTEKRNRHGTLVLEGWENLYLFFKEFSIKKVTPFNLHTARKQRAIRGMVSHSFTKTMCKYLSILSQNEKLTTEEFSKKLQIREDSCLTTLRKDQYSQFINIGGRGINRHPFNFSITKQGQELLEIISTLRR